MIIQLHNCQGKIFQHTIEKYPPISIHYTVLACLPELAVNINLLLPPIVLPTHLI